jgi:hypothetical protein
MVSVVLLEYKICVKLKRFPIKFKVLKNKYTFVIS